MSLNYEQEQTLIDNIIDLARIGQIVVGQQYYEREETKGTIKKYEDKVKNKIKKLSLLLNDEGKKELDSLIDVLENIEVIRCENSFNNGVRSGLDNLAFLKDYFSIF